MLFSKLSQYFEKLESTSSRLALIDILAELFGEVSKDEVGMVSYLLQGRVAPFYKPIEMGMSEKLVAQAMARAYGVEREEILKDYGKVGDLGKVAENLSGVKRHPERSEGSQDSKKTKSRDSSQARNDKLTVEEVFKTLTEIAKISGDGTVEKKITLLSGLLEKMDGISAKHLVRVPLGASRLGIGDPTILDAFAKLKLGDKAKRPLLEGAYNRISDLGIIGQTLWSKGIKGVQGLDVQVGRPIRSQLCERITDPKAILEKYGGVAHVQYKYDGFRVQIHKEGNKVRLFSRNLEETTLMFPDIIAGVLKQVKAKSIILDSEALAYNPESEEFLPFQETTKRRRKYGIPEMQKKLPLKAFVFDIMYLDGKSLMEESLVTRVKSLEKVIHGDEVLIPQPGEMVKNPDRLQAIFDDALTKGLEGVITKRPDSKYEAGGRNSNWIKLKRNSSGELQDTIDCVILGYIFGKGKRSAFGAGALLVGVYDEKKDEFVTVSKIGTGLTDEEWREIHKRADKIKVSKQPARVNSILKPSVWIAPEIVIEVLADEITRSPVHTAGRDENGVGYALRFPRLIKFREKDKTAEDATTVKELVEMYKGQFKK
ncbi:DNA ligase [Candidatus Daviesbacteria bacterium RIFCSPHIGHO2_12_FULL_37_11]|uniref:Probable DNA ligase n=1 Tax=Candidatus Daviesbacteria bacterium RIFCSPHIGHO2_12_FULL_37_11 TaxID=1797777 RepID=A0A1F5KA49_9BACT|nr:MAG: DNA ligase [Candidatus Daviesbacteria bacterium RIFCSPHIGHO2_01_FULL_37_27]OGE37827.1 MAG: DNA ligase [Candidatus Daviesbacteria bacterium RIFCSPHIGHO2_12_FULL_37_11]OGE45457.1 MAG: DNA ligase [Candidatus Daviesbacteria bacterium RIFCSPLOWO2_01_FULL_37_10]